ncbi:MAG: aspartate aminotransferase family protein [Chloroflexi bacterium]|nr:aspartate aminotransferase family protein [Chloroflexota bacterium]
MDFVSSTPASQEWYSRATAVLPAGVTYSSRHMSPHPVYIKRAAGGRVYDLDGNEYLDFWMGHGALVLGHCFPPVVEAVQQQVALGAHFGFCHEWEVLLAQQIVDMVPSAEMVRFANSGTEANMYAIRLARSATGRSKIAKYEGGWHGGYDALHKASSAPLDASESLGLTQGALEDTVALPFNDLETSLQAIHRGDLAAVMIEVVQGAAGFIPAERAFLQSIREACTATGTMLMYDEVVTGFRLAPGGGQELYGILPDITTLGKIVGGGAFPVGALCGRQDLMELIDHLKHPDKSQRSYQGGTYAGNPLVCRAGYVTLTELERRQDAIYPHLNALGERCRQGIEGAFRRAGIPAHATGIGALASVHLTPERPRDMRSASRNARKDIGERYSDYLRDHRVLYRGSHPHFYISAAHTTQDIDHLVSLTEEFVRTV